MMHATGCANVSWGAMENPESRRRSVRQVELNNSFYIRQYSAIPRRALMHPILGTRNCRIWVFHVVPKLGEADGKVVQGPAYPVAVTDSHPALHLVTKRPQQFPQAISKALAGHERLG
ncbi:metallo-beta-lactamase domain protein, partial [Lasius niger]